LALVERFPAPGHDVKIEKGPGSGTDISPFL
jgi:hypothetical protein